MSECFLERLFKYRATEGRSPEEDFFTEAFAGVLESRPKMSVDFAAWLTEREIKSADVATQKVVNATNRLDMWFKARDENGGNHLVVLEHKLGARQGSDQLRRYERYLTAQVADSYTLVYVTMHEHSNFEPLGEAVSFRNLHWFEVYDWLEDWIRENDDIDSASGGLTRELLRLMEAWGMEMGLGARELASAVEYKGSVQSQLLQILDEVREQCREDCLSVTPSRCISSSNQSRPWQAIRFSAASDRSRLSPVSSVAPSAFASANAKTSGEDRAGCSRLYA